MKIAVPVKGNNQIDDHFGHCEQYSVFTITQSGEIQDISAVASNQGCGCKSNIASILASEGVTIMLAGGIGAGAVSVLNQAGIEVVRGCTGNAEEVVKGFISGEITDNGSICQQHQHHHGECNH
jgi:predicted Fe-Mo cluster-binding NifX family protein